MATKSISQLDTIAEVKECDLLELAAADEASASGYKSVKTTADTLADGILNKYTYPLAMPNMQHLTVVGALNQLLSNFAAVYDSTEATYAEGDVVTFAGQLYRCIAAVQTPEEFDIGKWEATTVINVINKLKAKEDEMI